MNIKLLIIAVVILTFTSIVFAGQKTDKHFSIFNKSYLPTWPSMDHSLKSYKNHNDGDHDWYDKDSDYSDNHKWNNDDSDDFHNRDWDNDNDANDDSDDTVVVAVVPEPVSSVLFVIGGATLGFRQFRKNFKK
jgi:hypothetical protein